MTGNIRPVIVCARCGAVGDRGEVPGLCTVCSPPPETWVELTAEVEARHRRATTTGEPAPDRSESDFEPNSEPNSVLEQARASRPAGLVWRWVPSRGYRIQAHVFGRGAARSLCGHVRDIGQLRAAVPGLRGCRVCAFYAGWTATKSESVTT